MCNCLNLVFGWPSQVRVLLNTFLVRLNGITNKYKPHKWYGAYSDLLWFGTAMAHKKALASGAKSGGHELLGFGADPEPE